MSRCTPTPPGARLDLVRHAPCPEDVGRSREWAVSPVTGARYRGTFSAGVLHLVGPRGLALRIRCTDPV